jgi:hypothetical protein
VRFTGTGPAEGPLNLGQLNILDWLRGESEQFYAAVAGVLDIPAATVVDDVTETLAALLGRHEGLRTTYVDGEPPRQQVLATGELAVDVYSIESGDPRLVDMASLTRNLVRRLRARGAYRMTELPIRAAVAVLPGETSSGSSVVHAAVIGCSHLAVDYQAMEIVKREFADMVRDPATRQAGGTRVQPLELAALERLPKALRHGETALSYWADRLSRMARCLYPVPRVSAETGSACVEMSSIAAGMALRAVAARTRTSRASVVLAAVCAVISRRTGYRELVFPTLSGNRFEPLLQHHVGTLAQTTLATVDVGETTFDRLARQAWAAVVHASRYGRYDVFRRVDIARRIEHERGILFDYEPLFNNLAIESGPTAETGTPSPHEWHAARSATQLRRQPMPAGRTLVRFDLFDTDGTMRLACWSSDIGRVPAGEVESLLLAVENVLIAAGDGDLDAQGIHDSIPIDPVDRGVDWLLVDGCWVELTEVRRLLHEALAPADGRIFTAVDDRQWVAYLTRTESVRTPEQAHARCMAALPADPTAVAPKHYVICETVPTDPDDPAAWTTVICQGSGRAGQ